MMTKIATGLDNTDLVDLYFGGDYALWSYIYKKTLIYVAHCYRNIIRHQGLARYLNEFPRFHRAIQNFCTTPREYQDLNGDWGWLTGLAYLPLDIIGFIDNSIDRTCVPLSGPREDCVGAARNADYDEMQRAFYTGYKKYHGIKYESILLPNGLVTLFGPVSARHSDRGVQLMSNINRFLVNLQNGVFSIGDRPVFFSVFGDSAYHGVLRCIQSYYKSLNGEELPEVHKDVNYYLSAARMTIEKNYGMVSNLFQICTNIEANKLAKEKPYACE